MRFHVTLRAALTTSAVVLLLCTTQSVRASDLPGIAPEELLPPGHPALRAFALAGSRRVTAAPVGAAPSPAGTCSADFDAVSDAPFTVDQVSMATEDGGPWGPGKTVWVAATGMAHKLIVSGATKYQVFQGGDTSPRASGSPNYFDCTNRGCNTSDPISLFLHNPHEETTPYAASFSFAMPSQGTTGTSIFTVAFHGEDQDHSTPDFEASIIYDLTEGISGCSVCNPKAASCNTCDGMGTATLCNGRGTCDLNSYNPYACECNGMYGGDSCEGCILGHWGATCHDVCPGRMLVPDEHGHDHHEAYCNNHGSCEKASGCVCDAAYTGDDCNTCAAGYFGPHCDRDHQPSAMDMASRAASGVAVGSGILAASFGVAPLGMAAAAASASATAGAAAAGAGAAGAGAAGAGAALAGTAGAGAASGATAVQMAGFGAGTGVASGPITLGGAASAATTAGGVAVAMPFVAEMLTSLQMPSIIGMLALEKIPDHLRNFALGLSWTHLLLRLPAIATLVDSATDSDELALEHAKDGTYVPADESRLAGADLAKGVGVHPNAHFERYWVDSLSVNAAGLFLYALVYAAVVLLVTQVMGALVDLAMSRPGFQAWLATRSARFQRVAHIAAARSRMIGVFVLGSVAYFALCSVTISRTFTTEGAQWLNFTAAAVLALFLFGVPMLLAYKLSIHLALLGRRPRRPSLSQNLLRPSDAEYDDDEESDDDGDGDEDDDDDTDADESGDEESSEEEESEEEEEEDDDGADAAAGDGPAKSGDDEAARGRVPASSPTSRGVPHESSAVLPSDVKVDSYYTGEPDAEDEGPPPLTESDVAFQLVNGPLFESYTLDARLRLMLLLTFGLRMVEAAIVVLLRGIPVAQVGALVLVNVLAATYLWVAKPFESRVATIAATIPRVVGAVSFALSLAFVGNFNAPDIVINIAGWVIIVLSFTVIFAYIVLFAKPLWDAAKPHLKCSVSLPKRQPRPRPKPKAKKAPKDGDKKKGKKGKGKGKKKKPKAAAEADAEGGDAVSRLANIAAAEGKASEESEPKGKKGKKGKGKGKGKKGKKAKAAAE